MPGLAPLIFSRVPKCSRRAFATRIRSPASVPCLILSFSQSSMVPHRGFLKWRSDRLFVRLDSHFYYIRFYAIQLRATGGTLPELNMCLTGCVLQPVGGTPSSGLLLFEDAQANQL